MISQTPTIKRVARSSAPGKGRLSEALVGYLLILPILTLFMVYEAYPFLRSFWISCTNYKFIGDDPVRFVGLANYARAINDEYVLGGLLKALNIALLNYVGGLAFPLIVALVLDRVARPLLAAIYRVCFYFPAVVPGALIWRLWTWIFLPSIGLLNYFLFSRLHILPRGLDWLSENALIVPSMMTVLWWSSIGTRTIFFLIGLEAIPEQLYEAARLDGANELQVVRYVSLPLLRNTIMVWTILSVGMFGVAQPMLVLFGARNITAVPSPVQTWGIYAYALGFVSTKMPLGYATAVSWVGGLIMLGFAFLLRRVFIEKEPG